MLTSVCSARRVLASVRISQIAAALVFALGAVPATAQIFGSGETAKLRARVERLEREMQGQRGGAAANTLVRLDQFEEELRQITGKLEHLRHDQDRMAAEQKRRLDDFEFRIVELEGGDPTTLQQAPAPDSASQPDSTSQSGAAQSGGALGVGAPPSTLGVIPGDAVPTGLAAASGDASLDMAFEQLKAGDYDKAEGKFNAFIAANPKDQRAGEAYYWLGEMAYSRGTYDVAARTFLKSFSDYPDSRKAPDSLLKLGMTLMLLGQKSEACETFAEVRRRYPKASKAVLRRAQIEVDRGKCS